MVGIYNFSLTANLSFVGDHIRKSRNAEIEELDSRVGLLELTQSISQFIALIYVLYFIYVL